MSAHPQDVSIGMCSRAVARTHEFHPQSVETLLEDAGSDGAAVGEEVIINFDI